MAIKSLAQTFFPYVEVLKQLSALNIAIEKSDETLIFLLLQVIRLLT